MNSWSNSAAAIGDDEPGRASLFDRFGLLGAAVLTVLATWIGVYPLAVLGLLVIVTAATARAWSGVVFWRLTYDRLLSTPRAFVGDEITLTLRLQNPKPIPVPWAAIQERIPRLLATDEPPTPMSDRDSTVVEHTASLWWYRQRSWQHRLTCRRRGVYRLGPARLASGDLFGLYPRANYTERTDALLVYPEIIDLPDFGIDPDELIGALAVSRPILPDPMRVVGVREYRPSDPRRQVHWKASARRQLLHTKILEPASTHRLLLALDLSGFDHAWLIYREDLFELAVSTVATLALEATERGCQVGVLVNSADVVDIQPAGRTQHLMRILETLAVLSLTPGSPIESVIHRSKSVESWGVSLVVVTAAISPDLVAFLQSSRRSAHRPLVVHVGLDRPPNIEGIPIKHLEARG